MSLFNFSIEKNSSKSAIILRTEKKNLAKLLPKLSSRKVVGEAELRLYLKFVFTNLFTVGH